MRRDADRRHLLSQPAQFQFAGPKCQGPARAAWLAARQAELLPVPYCHVVVTLPPPVAAIAFQNKRLVYVILFRAAAEAMMTLAANPRRLGAGVRWRTHDRHRDLRPRSGPTIPGAATDESSMTVAARIRPPDVPTLRDRPTAASGILRPRRPFGLPAGNATAPQNPEINRASAPSPVTPPLSLNLARSIEPRRSGAETALPIEPPR